MITAGDGEGKADREKTDPDVMDGYASKHKGDIEESKSRDEL